MLEVVGWLIWPCSMSCWKGVCRHLVEVDVIGELTSLPTVIVLGLVVVVSSPLISMLGSVIVLSLMSKFLIPVDVSIAVCYPHLAGFWTLWFCHIFRSFDFLWPV